MVEGRTVLLVEDEPLARELMADVLRDAGYIVDEVPDGAQAMHALEAHPAASTRYCLVVLDMMLPDVDGGAVLQHLADSGASVPVVAMSGSSQQLSLAVEAGARGVVAKPFDFDALLHLVAYHRLDRDGSRAALLAELRQVEAELRCTLPAVATGSTRAGELDVRRALAHVQAAQWLLEELG